MQDPRLKKLAELLVNYSISLQPDEPVLIEVIDAGAPLALEVVAEVYRVGGVPFLQVHNRQLERQLIIGARQPQLEKMAQYELVQMREMQAYLAIRGNDNSSEWADLDGTQLQKYMSHYSRPVTDQRVNHTKWCVLRYPTPSMAQAAGMSSTAFEDYFFETCILDYRRLAKDLEPLRRLMEATDQVRLVGPGTDLSFSIKGIPVIPCVGTHNIPDGEIFTAPIRDSVNGRISFNTPAVFQGVTHERVELHFEQGKIIQAASSAGPRLQQVLETDAGARYVGEFSLGVNPQILKPMRDTLFDEKIWGSIHFTPGQAYEEADNGNRSAIHWDLVLLQTPEYGGGEIYFDNRLIRKDGQFVLAELKGLNPA